MLKGQYGQALRGRGCKNLNLINTDKKAINQKRKLFS